MNFYPKDIVRAQTTAITYHFFIHGPIEGSEDYIDLLDALYNATPTDVIIHHLNTPGGYLDTAVEIIHAIAQTEATVVGSADGQVASAGSLILFAYHTFVLGEFCEVMLHDGSGGSWGKINENLKAAEHTSQRIANIYHKVYGRFFPEEEVQAILDGADLYLSAEDVELLIELAIESAEEEVGDEQE
jgi:ATP-dependent protease ClpP protease subunit